MPNQTPLLDDRDKIAEIDQHFTLQSIEELGSQITQIWDLAQSLNLDPSYSQVTSVVVAGMGGSVLGTDVIQSLYKESLKVPITIAPDYDVPAFVNENTLVIVSSYSGNTEETLAAAEDAYTKGAKLIATTSGGKIADFFAEKKLPALVYDTSFNRSQCARMGLGYSIFGQIALFAQAGLITVTKNDYQDILDAIAAVHLRAGQLIGQESNVAKVLAFNLINKIPVITVSEHLAGVAHVFANQLNENAKTFAEYRVIPEMNHHLMEGMQFPESADHVLQFVTVHSDLYHPRNQLRTTLTEEIIEDNKLEFIRLNLESKTKIGQAFELITLAAYTAFYLAMIYNQDPIPNPHVDWLKDELAKRSA